MTRTARLLSVFALMGPAGLSAQERDGVVRRHDVASSSSWHRAPVRWGKWLATGAAVAFTVMGAHEHENSNREFGRLLDMCRANTADCQLGPDGTYLNAAAERLYQTSIHYDRRARTRLLAGQASFLVAAALFITELRRRPGEPENKPFSPLDVAGDGRTGDVRVGIRLGF